ncbi:MAG: hypothetical protein ACLQUY_16910 [Ktedonobacterales bacterium]
MGEGIGCWVISGLFGIAKRTALRKSMPVFVMQTTEHCRCWLDAGVKVRPHTVQVWMGRTMENASLSDYARR